MEQFLVDGLGDMDLSLSLKCNQMKNEIKPHLEIDPQHTTLWHSIPITAGRS